MTSDPDASPLVPTVLLHTEELSVGTKKVLGETVRVSTVTREHEQLIDEMLTHEQVEIERIAVNRPVDSIPPVRHEGDFIILPVVEETIVVERRFFLKEEVRVRRVRVQERHQENVMVRDQEAVIIRGGQETAS